MGVRVPNVRKEKCVCEDVCKGSCWDWWWTWAGVLLCALKISTGCKKRVEQEFGGRSRETLNGGVVKEDQDCAVMEVGVGVGAGKGGIE